MKDVVELQASEWQKRTERALPRGAQAVSGRALFTLHFHGVLLAAAWLGYSAIPDRHAQVGRVLALLAVMSLIFAASILRFAGAAGRAAGFAIVIWAVVFRMIAASDAVTPRKLLSSDIYRYVWEGRVAASGLNPYALAPEDPRLEHLAGDDGVWDNIHHRAIPAVYPPGAQILLSHLPADPRLLRWCFAVFDAVTVVLLLRWLKFRNLPQGYLLYYAWLPLAVLETAANSHLEAAFLPLSVLGLYADERSRHPIGAVIAAYCLALAVSIKFVAAVPLFYLWTRHIRGRDLPPIYLSGMLLVPPAVLGLLYLPFLSEGGIWRGLQAYSASWEFNASIFYFLRAAAGWAGAEDSQSAARTAVSLIAGAAACALAVRRRSPAELSLICYLAVLLVSPVVYPWYLLWAAVFMPFAESAVLRNSFALFCCTALVSYEVLAHPADWNVPPVLSVLEYLPLLAALGAGIFVAADRAETG